jgi:quercetin dioxygenase-like cupin family protein
MEEQRTREAPLPYTIQSTEIVAGVPDLRVVVLTLRPGEEVPWHWHSNVSDKIFCLDGTLEIEMRVPRERRLLAAAERFDIAPKRAHVVRNAGAGVCRYLIVQGDGVYDFNPVGGA